MSSHASAILLQIRQCTPDTCRLRPSWGLAGTGALPLDSFHFQGAGWDCGTHAKHTSWSSAEPGSAERRPGFPAPCQGPLAGPLHISSLRGALASAGFRGKGPDTLICLAAHLVASGYLQPRQTIQTIRHVVGSRENTIIAMPLTPFRAFQPRISKHLAHVNESSLTPLLEGE